MLKAVGLMINIAGMLLAVNRLL